mmetsp:Transcript_20795/g.30626  ORF Transcript_20795/g.30626 Transcript_20795/m.30626 type:complete len:131 (+) Transcript_20795:125-517(+)
MIIYTVICRDTDGAVLVESSSGISEGNFPQITRELITCLINNPDSFPKGGRKTFVYRGGDPEDGYFNFGGVSNTMTTVFQTVGMGDCFAPGDFEDSADEDDIDLFYHALHGEELICICLSDDVLGRNQKV